MTIDLGSLSALMQRGYVLGWCAIVFFCAWLAVNVVLVGRGGDFVGRGE